MENRGKTARAGRGKSCGPSYFESDCRDAECRTENGDSRIQNTVASASAAYQEFIGSHFLCSEFPPKKKKTMLLIYIICVVQLI